MQFPIETKHTPRVECLDSIIGLQALRSLQCRLLWLYEKLNHWVVSPSFFFLSSPSQFRNGTLFLIQAKTWIHDGCSCFVDPQ